MSDGAKGLPGGGKNQPPNMEKTQAQIERARRKRQRQRERARQNRNAPHEPVLPCQWTLSVKVVAKEFAGSGRVMVQIEGGGERLTPDQQPTQMIDGTAAEVVFQ